MKQTPMHEIHNPDVLRLIPRLSKKIIEIGCSSGALARAYNMNYNNTYWVGMEIDSLYAQRASEYCNEVIIGDIESCNEEFYKSHEDKECWIFADVLEHLRDPWKVLKNIRNIIPENGSIIACIPNAQHWTLIARLVVGNFRYEEMGLMDKTHLRWFTRTTIIELFEMQGFKIVEVIPRVFQAPNPDLLKCIIELAGKFGRDPESTKKDIGVFQYVVRAVPADGWIRNF